MTLRSVVSATWMTALRTFCTSITARSGLTTRYQITAFTCTGTLSRVMDSCFSTPSVSTRMSTFTARSTPSGMIQNRPGPLRARVAAEAEHQRALILLGDAETRDQKKRRDHGDDR